MVAITVVKFIPRCEAKLQQGPAWVLTVGSSATSIISTPNIGTFIGFHLIGINKIV